LVACLPTVRLWGVGLIVCLVCGSAGADVIGLGLIDADAPGPPLSEGAYLHPNWLRWPPMAGDDRLLSPVTGLDWLPVPNDLHETAAGSLSGAAGLAKRGFYEARASVLGDRSVVCETLPGAAADTWAATMASQPDGTVTYATPSTPLPSDAVAFFRAHDWTEAYRLAAVCRRTMVIEYRRGQGSRSRVWLLGEWPGAVASPGPIPGLIEARQSGPVLVDPAMIRWLPLDAREHGAISYLDGLRVQSQCFAAIFILGWVVFVWSAIAVAKGRANGWLRLAIEVVSALVIAWHGMGPSIARQGTFAMVGGGSALLLGLGFAVFGVGKLLSGLQRFGNFHLQEMFGFALVGAVFGWMSGLGWSAVQGLSLYVVAALLWRPSGRRSIDALTLSAMVGGLATFLGALRGSGDGLDFGAVSAFMGSPHPVVNADERFNNLPALLPYFAGILAVGSASLLTRRGQGFWLDHLRAASARVVRIPMTWLWAAVSFLLPLPETAIAFSLLWLAVLREACRTEGG